MFVYSGKKAQSDINKRQREEQESKLGLKNGLRAKVRDLSPLGWLVLTQGDIAKHLGKLVRAKHIDLNVLCMPVCTSVTSSLYYNQKKKKQPG